MSIFYIAPIVTCCIFLYFSASSQELEPRSLTNIPIGTNFILAGYGYAHGNILFDPALPLEDTKANLHTGVLAYLRSVNIFGLSGKLDVIAPYGIGNWSGLLSGIDTATSRNGFGDLRFRLSFNFLGAPALKASEFKDYKPEKISGFSIQIYAPTGQYFSDKLINLGSNRWVFRPQWGFSRNYPKWILESYLSMWIYTTNSNFYGGNEFKQNPLFTIKLHSIRKFDNKSWLAIDTGYGIGGRSRTNGVLGDNRISTFRFGLTYAIPVKFYHTLRFTGISSLALERGADFDGLAVTYQYMWMKK